MQMLTSMTFSENSQNQLVHKKKKKEIQVKNHTAVQMSYYYYEVF